MSTNAAGSRTAKRLDVKKVTILAMFTALGYLCLFVFRFKVSFLTLDFKDVFITLSGFVYGPLAAAGVALAETLLELVTLSDTGFWGALMNFAGSAAFAVTASLIYKFNKNYKGAVIGLIASVFCMTAVMLLMNIIVTPIYMHTDVKTVTSMIPKLLLPFNLIKSLLNASIAFILYKPLSQAFKAAGLIPKGDNSFKVNRKSVIGLVIALAVIVFSIVMIFNFFDGSSFEIVKQ
ncbi:MAG: ECF transporter S component [Ruminococcus sp.]|nr:ECF transporter S component [Ruminococcus sp.]